MEVGKEDGAGTQNIIIYPLNLTKDGELINLKHPDRPSPPTPLPNLGEGSKKILANFWSPFSQRWEKGLGDEGQSMQ
jgi:hypothetical protein